ncbi:hypothetical protein [Labilibacter marinus]|uniref:hypothetical protein n=1 Tax=Labilibacter marinus TaxID=1477105 RepID=UPI00094FD8FF|nr:hypothetical protein [Labilibacter marinus]
MQEQSGAIELTSEYFKVLIDQVIETYKSKHKLQKLPKMFQLFGYGAFDETKPSIKSDFEKIGSDVINGKYLYDKYRDVEKGKSSIKINEHYKNIILLYLGYNDIQQFINDNPISDYDIDRQNSLIQDNKEDISFYYINYYFGEDDIIIKGKTIISNNWKRIQHIFLYPLPDGTIREHYSNGTVHRQGDTIYMRTKTISGGKNLDGASEIYYIGHKSPSSINYMVGTYCTFDVYTNTVAGRTILERCETKEMMEHQAQNEKIPAYIAMEVRDKRIVNSNNIVGKHYLELSHNTPYASIYGKIPGIYKFVFGFKDVFNEVIEFKILPYNYKIISLTENVHIEKDRFEMINKGSILNFRFTFSGIIIMERVNIYVKTYFLKGGKSKQEGVFSGVDNENRLVNGDLMLEYTPLDE